VGYATAAGNRLPMANLVRLMRQVIPMDKISTRAIK
jgi:histone H3/H4